MAFGEMRQTGEKNKCYTVKHGSYLVMFWASLLHRALGVLILCRAK